MWILREVYKCRQVQEMKERIRILRIREIETKKVQTPRLANKEPGSNVGGGGGARGSGIVDCPRLRSG